MVGPEDSAWHFISESLLDFADTFVIDAYSKDKFGGTGNTSDWEAFKFPKGLSNKKWVLRGIGPQNVAQAIQVTNPAIIDLNSMVEIEPGIKEKENRDCL